MSERTRMFAEPPVSIRVSMFAEAAGRRPLVEIGRK